MSLPTSTKLLRNTAFNLGGRAAGYGVSLILTPLIFRSLGADQFGLWALTVMLAGQFGLVDLGFTSALSKYVSEFNARGTLGRINAPLTAALLFYVAVCIGLVIPLWTFRYAVFDFFSIPQPLWGVSLFVMPAAIFLFFATSTLAVFQSVINGLQRMEITNGVAVVQAILLATLTALALRLGKGLGGVILVNAACLLGGAIVLAVFCRTSMPGLKVTFQFQGSEFRSVLRFGAVVQLARVSGIVAAYSDRVLISHFLDLAWLGRYQLAYTIVAAMRGATLLLVSAVVPATSELTAIEQKHAIRALYRRGTKYSLITALAIAGIIVPLAGHISRAWLGCIDPFVVLGMRFLAVGHLFHVVTGLGTAMSEGMGRPEIEARFGVCLSVLQVLLGIVGVRWFGFRGILWTTVLVMAITSLWFLTRFHRVVEPEAPFPWRALALPPVIASLAASSLVWVVSSHLDAGVHGRIGAALLLLAGGSLFLAVYVGILAAVRYVDEFDLQLTSAIGRAILRPKSARAPASDEG